MLYFLVRPLARIALKIHFRKIYFHNKEAILLDKPLLLAANHPTAFIEPCVLACFQPKPLNFLVRGDLFVKPFYIKLLNALHMVPMFRLKDGGYQKLKRNYETLEYCFQALRQNKTIMILAEGSTKHEKRLRPLRKGTARIAFGAIEKYNDLDIHVVPVGVNYTYADRFREDVMIEFGTPIRVMDYMNQYVSSPAEAMRQLLEDLKAALQKRIIIIDATADELLTERLFVMARNDQPFSWRPVVEDTNEQLQRERNIALTINSMEVVEKEQLDKRVNAYFAELKQLGIQDKAVIQQASPKQAFGLAIGAIPAAIGYALNYPPIALAKFILHRFVKSIEFKMSVALAIELVAFPLYWLLLLLFSVLILPGAIGWLVGLAVPVLGYIALHFRDFYLEWKARGGGQSVSISERERLKQLRDAINIPVMLTKIP